MLAWTCNTFTITHLSKAAYSDEILQLRTVGIQVSVMIFERNNGDYHIIVQPCSTVSACAPIGCHRMTSQLIYMKLDWVEIGWLNSHWKWLCKVVLRITVSVNVALRVEKPQGQERNAQSQRVFNEDWDWADFQGLSWCLCCVWVLNSPNELSFPSLQWKKETWLCDLNVCA